MCVWRMGGGGEECMCMFIEEKSHENGGEVKKMSWPQSLLSGIGCGNYWL